jgi:hypothetical protein
MNHDLEQIAYDIGKRFGNEKLTVKVDPYFTEVENRSGTIKGRSVFSESLDNHLHVYIQLPGNVSDREKEIRIAHEFGEIAFKKNHPTISKMLHILGYNRFVGEISRLLNDSLADMEARKRGFKIPYLYHLGYHK